MEATTLSRHARRLASTQPTFDICDCGFIDAYDPDQAVYTTYYRVDFTDSTYTRTDLTGQFRLADNEVDSRSTGGRYVRDYSPNQVALNVGNQVGLTVSPVSSRNTSAVNVAGVYTTDYDWSFGSYHLQAQVANVSGTVAAFFVYRDESNAVVMEYVSKPNTKDAQFIRDTVAPQIYEADGDPSPLTYGTTKPPTTNPSFSAAVHNWGFSWRPNQVTYGLDNVYSTKLTTNVPQSPGLLAFSHWSDGNPSYSQGPPTRNATMNVRQMWALHNSTIATGNGSTVYNAMYNGVSSTTPVMACQQRKRPCYVTTPGGSLNGLSLTKPNASGAIKRATSGASGTSPVGTALAIWLLCIVAMTLR